MPQSQIGVTMPGQLGGLMPNPIGGPLPAQDPNQMGVLVQNQGSPIPPSHSPRYRGPPGPGLQAPRMPRGPSYVDQGDGTMGPLTSPRYDGRPLDPAWLPQGNPSGENERQRLETQGHLTILITPTAACSEHTTLLLIDF